MQCCQPSLDAIQISLADQQLCYCEHVFPISSSRFGVGTEEGSNKTPLGSFQISEKIGAGDPIYSVYRGRRKQGVWAPEGKDCERDLILSRILRLTGMEGHNSNTYARYIYIHGTNDEARIGQERSIGCIRMHNADVITLNNLVPLGTPVHIS